MCTLHTHTHTHLTALCPGLPGSASTRKVKPIWILLEQETVSGSGISWAICKSASRSRQITTPAPHYSTFLQAGCTLHHRKLLYAMPLYSVCFILSHMFRHEKQNKMNAARNIYSISHLLYVRHADGLRPPASMLQRLPFSHDKRSL